MIERGELLDLGSDLALRYRYFSRASLAHPAKLQGQGVKEHDGMPWHSISFRWMEEPTNE